MVREREESRTAERRGRGEGELAITLLGTYNINLMQICTAQALIWMNFWDKIFEEIRQMI